MDTAVAAKPFLVSVAFCCFGALAALMLAGTAGGVVRGAQGGEQTYAGIGATVADFRAAHATTAGRPPAGATYYRIERIHNGRVAGYHVVVGWTAGRSTSAILARLTGRGLPSDAKLVVPYNGFCATYRSRWLGRVIGLPIIQVSAPTHAWWNGVWTGRGPSPRGGCKG